MIHNELERKQWVAERKSFKAEPDPEIKTIRGYEWARVRRLVCPQCQDEFYGMQCLDEPLPQGIQNDYPYGNGRRETCGDPQCDEAEQHHQNMKRQREYLANYQEPAETKTKGKGVM